MFLNVIFFDGRHLDLTIRHKRLGFGTEESERRLLHYGVKGGVVFVFWAEDGGTTTEGA